MKKNLLAAFILLQLSIQAQNNRIHTYDGIGWYNLFATVKVSDKLGFHAEYQWRRDHIITQWQQSLLRTGINYQTSPRILLRAGYAWIETFPYGTITINEPGRRFTEHRAFQMIQYSHQEGRLQMSQRLILEQRFIGKYLSPNDASEADFPLSHRIRYMTKFELPLGHQAVEDHTPYLAAYDEIFISFGKNVKANIFDQNRAALLFGYRFNQRFKMEAGYLNQVLQLGRLVNAHNVFQHNNGLIVNAYFNIAVSSHKSEKDLSAAL